MQILASSSSAPQSSPRAPYGVQHLYAIALNRLIQHFLSVDARPRRVVPRVPPIGKCVHEPVEAVAIHRLIQDLSARWRVGADVHRRGIDLFEVVLARVQ